MLQRSLFKGKEDTDICF